MSLAHRKNINDIHLGVNDSFKRIGLTLRDARRLQTQSIKDVSEQLRISVDYLSKLETGAFHDLPAPAYVNGFLRSYAQYLGLVPDLLVGRYAALTNVKGAKLHHKMPMTTRPPQRSAPAIASALVVVAAVAYGSWFWVKGGAQNAKSTITATNEIQQPSKRSKIVTLGASMDDYAKVPSDSVGEQIVDFENVIEVDVGALNSEGGSLSNKTKSRVPSEILKATNVPVIAEPQEIDATLTSAKKSIESSEPDRSDQFEETQILAAPFLNSTELQNSSTAVANLRDPTQEITIRAVASSWVEIVQDNGEEVLAKLMQAGDVYVVESNTRLYLSTGNAGGLTVVIGADEPIVMGGIGEIVRDLPLTTDKLRKIF